MKRRSAVSVANDSVSIVMVCRMFGVDLPDGVDAGRSSRKVHCPFGSVYHSDQGVSAAMRIYPDTNSAYCFSCSAQYTPVSLAARAMDCDRNTAAVRLLDQAGIKPLDQAAAWQQVSHYEPSPDRALLAHALKTYCRRIDAQWRLRQFDPQVAAVLSRCLSLLELVGDSADAELWLHRCKQAMQQLLHSL